MCVRAAGAGVCRRLQPPYQPKTVSPAVSFQSLPSFTLFKSLALTAPVDRRTMDAEGRRAVHRDKSARRLAVVVAMNLLVGACLVTLYYWHVNRDVQEQTFEENVHIDFVAIADISHNGPLQFGVIRSSSMMGLVDGKRDKIYVNCSGPYVLYMDVCYKSLRGQESRGTLQLQVVGNEAPVSSFPLTASQEVCRGLQSVAYLRAKEEASLHFHSPDGLKVKSVTVGLNYLLGSRCQF